MARKSILRIQADGEYFAQAVVWQGPQVVWLSVVGWETDAARNERSEQAIGRAWPAVKQAGISAISAGSFPGQQSAA